MAASYRRKFFHSFLTVDKEGKMKKSVRKTLSLILVIITVLALFAQPAFAISQKLLDEIDKTNEQIFKEVEKTQEKAEKEALKGKSRRNFVGGAGEFDNRRRCDCECVFECLFDLLDDALEDNFGRCPR
jgi:hypothetical protein